MDMKPAKPGQAYEDIVPQRVGDLLQLCKASLIYRELTRAELEASVVEVQFDAL